MNMKTKLTILLIALLSYSSSNAQCAASCTATVNPVNNGDVSFVSSVIGGGPYSYFWNFADGTSSGAVNPTHTFNSGTWNVCLTVSDSLNNITCVFCDSVTVINNNLPSCNAYFTFIDSSGYVYFNDLSTGTGLTYNWNFGDGMNGTSVGSASHLYSLNGTYYVCLTIANSFLGCSSTYCDSVTIGNGGGNGGTCSASFTSVTDTSGFGVTFSSSISGTADTYGWNFGDASSSSSANPFHLYTSPGTYSACLTVTSSTDSTCYYTVCQNIVIGAPAGGCSANFVIIQDSTNLYNYSIYSYTNNNNTTTYLWSFGDGTSSTSAFPSHTYSGSGPYLICLTITDSTALGSCTASYCDSIYPGHGSSQVTTISVYNGMTVGIHENTSTVETLDNYPNPFTTATTITYSLKQNSSIELNIVDLLGNKVATVESGSKSSGNHTVSFDAAGISAGIYMLQLKTDNKFTTKKLVITK